MFALCFQALQTVSANLLFLPKSSENAPSLTETIYVKELSSLLLPATPPLFT